MKQYKTTTTLLFATFFVTIILFVGYGTAFLLMEKKIKDTASLVENAEEVSGKESHIVATLTKIKENEDSFKKLDTYFIKEGDIVSFAKKIEELGLFSGSALTIEALDQGVTEASVPLLNLRIRATGEFVSIMRLVRLLQNFPGVFEWKTVRLTHLEEGDIQGGGDSVVTMSKKKAGGSLWKVEVSLTVFNFIKE